MNAKTGNRAVFLGCDGNCSGSNRVLYLLDADRNVRELTRNAGAPFYFTGSLVALARYIVTRPS